MNEMKTNDAVAEGNVIDNVFCETVEAEAVVKNNNNGGKKNRFKLDSKTASKWKEWMFLFCTVGIAMVQFAIHWVGAKISAFTVAFQDYNPITGEYDWVGMMHFKDIFDQFFISKTLLQPWGRSALVYFVGLCTFPIHILTAYCLWKKVPFSNFLKVLYVLPGVFPGMVFAMFFKYFMEQGMAELMPNSNLSMIFNRNAIVSGIVSADYTFWVIQAWNIIMGFAGGLIIYLGTISDVNQSVVEYGKLDGLGALGEFYHIIMPHLYGLFSVQIIGGVVSVFTADIGLMQYFGSDKTGHLGPPESLKTLGFIMSDSTLGGEGYYGWVGALGFAISAIAIPLTFLVRHLMEKWGPSED